MIDAPNDAADNDPIWDMHPVEDNDNEEPLPDDHEPDPFHGNDAMADADVLANCGWGTDEDYGSFGGDGDW